MTFPRMSGNYFYDSSFSNQFVAATVAPFHVHSTSDNSARIPKQIEHINPWKYRKGITSPNKSQHQKFGFKEIGLAHPPPKKTPELLLGRVRFFRMLQRTILGGKKLHSYSASCPEKLCNSPMNRIHTQLFILMIIAAVHFLKAF